MPPEMQGGLAGPPMEGQPLQSEQNVQGMLAPDSGSPEEAEYRGSVREDILQNVPPEILEQLMQDPEMMLQYIVVVAVCEAVGITDMNEILQIMSDEQAFAEIAAQLGEEAVQAIAEEAMIVVEEVLSLGGEMQAQGQGQGQGMAQQGMQQQGMQQQGMQQGGGLAGQPMGG